jgi:predicted transcriptional regulator
MKLIKRKGAKKMRFTSVEIPEELYRRVQHHMVDTDQSLKEVIRRALEEHLARHEKGGSRK